MEKVTTKEEFAKYLAVQTGTTKAKAYETLNCVFGLLAHLHHIQNEPLNIRGLGSFRPVVRAERAASAIAPGTAEFRTVSFKASRTLRDFQGASNS